jgi:hypothetical protein
MKKPTLKVELDGGLQVIRCRKEDLDWESGKSLAICIPEFRGQKGDPDRCVIHIEWYDGRLGIRIYNGEEDAVKFIDISPDPALDHALNCPLTEVPKLLNSEDEDVLDIVEQRLKEGK